MVQEDQLGRQQSRFSQGRRKGILIAVPAIVSMYLVGACFGLLVCARSFFFLEKVHREPAMAIVQPFEYLTVGQVSNISFSTGRETLQSLPFDQSSILNALEEVDVSVYSRTSGGGQHLAGIAEQDKKESGKNYSDGTHNSKEVSGVTKKRTGYSSLRLKYEDLGASRKSGEETVLISESDKSSKGEFNTTGPSKEANRHADPPPSARQRIIDDPDELMSEVGETLDTEVMLGINVTTDKVSEVTGKLQEFKEVDFLHSNQINKFRGLDTRRTLHRMTAQKRRMWLKENWSKFQILHTDALSDKFLTRMNSFLCGHDPTGSSSSTTSHKNGEASFDKQRHHWSEEGCGVKSNPCLQRFFFTWISPSASNFGVREQLAIESVFKWHPSACVVIISRSLDTPEGRKLFKPFRSRGYRIMAVTPDHASLFYDTPAARWFRKLREGLQDPGEINLMQNLSNVMRLVALYKYGGIYLDTDMIVLKSFSDLRNTVGAQSMDLVNGKWTRLNNAVLVFDRNHTVVLKFIREFDRTFDGNKWGYNGPYLVSRVLKRLKNSEESLAVSILSSSAFYPYNWMRIRSIFRAPVNKTDTIRQVSFYREHSFSAHF